MATARETVAAVITTGTAGLGVTVTDHEPGPGVPPGPCIVAVSRLGRTRFEDRYAVTVALDPDVHTAEVLTSRAETVVETVDRALTTGLPSQWQTGTWTFGFERDAALYVARTELTLFTDEANPGASTPPSIGTLVMNTHRTTIATAVGTVLATFDPPVTTYAYPVWPGLNAGPVVACVAPLGLDRDCTYHQIAVLVSPLLGADDAQDVVDDIVWQLDDGLRAGLDGSFFFAGPGSQIEDGWDRVGWLDELQCFTAQTAVGTFR